MRRHWFHLLFAGSILTGAFLPAAAQTDSRLPASAPASANSSAPERGIAQVPPLTQPNFQGSVPSPATSGGVPGQPFALSLDEAVTRGLRYNLGAVSSRQAVREAQGESLITRSALLPNVNGVLRETVQQVDLASFGFKFNFPGFAIPSIIGPFNYFDLRASLTQKIADLQALRSYQSSRERRRAAELSVQDAREVVVYVVTNGYLQVLASAARVDSAKAQLTSAQSIFQQASDRFTSGLTARIDSTRSQVELQTQQQRLTAEQANFGKQKIALARLIGLPASQDLVLTDTLPFAPLASLTLEQALELASANRSDLKAAQAQMRAAELARKAAVAERFPTLDVAADYGAIGVNPANSHGTFSVTGAVRFPIFAGGRIRGDVEQADARLQQRRAEYENLRAQVEADVRTAFLDLTAAADQVQVSQSRRELAHDELTQASDRFASGVADTIEVVQAQQAVSTAEEGYIGSLSAHNLAKASVARAVGQAEKIMRDLLRSQ